MTRKISHNMPELVNSFFHRINQHRILKPAGKTRIGGLISKYRVPLFFGLCLLLSLILVYFCNPGGQLYRSEAAEQSGALLRTTKYFERMVYPKPHLFKPPRSDVLTMTPWFAPIVWEGTYNLDFLNEQFRQSNKTVGLTVFAIKKYVIFLQKFLETAETYFMVGHRVKYYIFTDRPEAVPNITVKAGREIVLLKVQSYPRWQEISMRRMEMISYYSQLRFINEVDFLVCIDVDMQFSDHVGVEILSEVFGTIHPGFYGAERHRFTNERCPISAAYIPQDEGDFYYAGALFGGTLAEVYKLTKKCHESIMADKKKNIEAVWQEESHLNKYFVYHKPTKILSPEYLWYHIEGRPKFLKKKRILIVPKNYATIRN